jgi:DNA-binding CsgD family transcriptional regulator
VGRAKYVDVLQQHLEEARDGHGHTLLMTGEAGVGKSRLVTEANVWAHQNGMEVLRGSCFEPDRMLPFGPILDLLRGYTKAHVAEKLKSVATELVKRLLDVRLPSPEIQPLPSLDPSQEKNRYFQALDELFLENTTGLLLIVEDIHWCDDTSLEFLLHFARQISTMPILLLLTYRNDELNPSLVHFLAVLDQARLDSELTLDRLLQTDVETMIAAIFEQSQPIKKEFAEAIYSLTDGNPFFVEETLKALMASGDIYYSMSGWTRKPLSELNIPRSIHDNVQRRIEQLGENPRNLLSLAATAGRRFDFKLLQHLTQYSETELVKQIKELVKAQLVVEESADNFLFRHALTQQAINSQLLVRERRALHRRIAETLEEIHNPPNNVQLAELAHHTYEAEMWEKAFEYARQAGEIAQHQLYTPRAALEHYGHAFEAARHISASIPLLLFHERGQVYETLGDYELAQADYQTELEEARTRGDQEAEWQAQIDLGFLSASRDFANAGAHFQAALALAPNLSNPALAALTLNRVGNWHLNLTRSSEALQYHLEAARIFSSLGDEHNLASTNDLLGITYLVASDLMQYMAHYEQAMKLYRGVNDLGGYLSSLSIYATRGIDYLSSTAVPVIVPLAERLRDGQQSLEISRQLGARPAETLANLWLGLSLVSTGEYGAGLKYIRMGLDLATEIGHRHFMATGHMLLGAFYFDIFAFPLAETHFEQAQVLARETDSQIWFRVVTAFLADTHTQQNHFHQADAILQQMLTSDTPMQTMDQRQLWRTKAEWCLAQGQAAEALAIAQQLIDEAPNSGMNPIPRLYLLVAEIALSLRRYATSQASLQAAHQVAETLDLKPLLWRILFARARLARAQGEDEQAEAYFESGNSLLDSLFKDLNVVDSSLPNYLREGAERLKRSGKNSARALVRDRFDGLTPRERDIAALIAQGKSNKEIAEALTLSSRTVEAHISRVLSKLNFSSRSQIAVWAVEKGLLKN